ncbi:unnamed protein product, partial [Closterium sp. NIES-54]
SPYDRHWRPCHSLLTLPLLVAFELLLCCYLAAREMCVARPPVDLAIVFLPLILLEGLVLVDNFRMCMALMPGEDDNMTDEALWETLPHFAVAVSMIFFMAATVFSVLKLNATVFSVLELNDVTEVIGIDWWTLLVDLCPLSSPPPLLLLPFPPPLLPTTLLLLFLLLLHFLASSRYRHHHHHSPSRVTIPTEGQQQGWQHQQQQGRCRGGRG